MDVSKFCDSTGTDQAFMAKVQKKSMEEWEILKEEIGKSHEEMDPEEFSRATTRVQVKVEAWIKEQKEEVPPEEDTPPEEGTPPEEDTPPEHPNELLWKLYQSGEWGSVKGEVYNEKVNPSLGRVKQSELEWFMKHSKPLHGHIYHTSPEGFYNADEMNDCLEIISDLERLKEEGQNFTRYYNQMEDFMKKNNYKGRDQVGEVSKNRTKFIAGESVVADIKEFTLMEDNSKKICDNPSCCRTAHVMMAVGNQMFTDLDVIEWYMSIPMYTKTCEIKGKGICEGGSRLREPRSGRDMDDSEDLCGLCIGYS